MPKSKKGAPSDAAGSAADAARAELAAALSEGFNSPAPGALLAVAGLILSSSAGADDPAETLAGLVQGLSARPGRDVGPVLAIATLTGDAELCRRVGQEWANADSRSPGGWRTDRTGPTSAPRDQHVVPGRRPLLVASGAGGHPLTAVVLVDNELRAFAAEG